MTTTDTNAQITQMHMVPPSSLTREVIGCGYSVYNRLGFGYQEKYYQRAMAQELISRGISFKREHSLRIQYENKVIGRYQMDFILPGLLVIELKVANEFYQKHINQVLAYLRHSGIRLGLLLLFTKVGVRVKRLIV